MPARASDGNGGMIDSTALGEVFDVEMAVHELDDRRIGVHSQ